MSFDYAEVAANALETLTEFGRDVTRRSYSMETAYDPPSAYDTTTGRIIPTTVDTTRKGVMFDFGAGQTLVRGSLVQAGDKRLLLDATATVAPQDHFIVGGVEYVAVSVGTIDPAGTAVVFDIHLRNG